MIILFGDSKNLFKLNDGENLKEKINKIYKLNNKDINILLNNINTLYNKEKDDNIIIDINNINYSISNIYLNNLILQHCFILFENDIIELFFINKEEIIYDYEYLKKQAFICLNSKIISYN